MAKSQDVNYPTLQFNNSKIIDRITIFLARFFANYFWIVVDIFSHHDDKIAEYYERSIGKEYKNECKKINIAKGSKILHIGCGSYPLTEMTLAKLFDVKIVGIDKSKKAVMRASEVVLKKKLNNKITIEKGNGANYSLEKFDMVIVSSCALPKKEIFDHIFKTAKKNSIIIIRDLDAVIDEILSCIDANEDITIEKRIHHPNPFKPFLGWNAFHLKKK